MARRSDGHRNRWSTDQEVTHKHAQRGVTEKSNGTKNHITRQEHKNPSQSNTTSTTTHLGRVQDLLNLAQRLVVLALALEHLHLLLYQNLDITEL